jgi:hypothetical protein
VPLHEVAPHVPLSVERVVSRALEKRPEDRFATAGEMGEALGRVAAASGEPTLVFAPVASGIGSGAAPAGTLEPRSAGEPVPEAAAADMAAAHPRLPRASLIGIVAAALFACSYLSSTLLCPGDGWAARLAQGDADGSAGGRLVPAPRRRCPPPR